LRIIAGQWKGRKLLSPEDKFIRPTSDKVKEGVFSSLAPIVPDAVVVDLFAGTGNLGLEALSRGAQRVYFGDVSAESMALTRKNIKLCGAQEQSVCFQGDWKRVLNRVADEAAGKVDLIFLDPPYMGDFYEDCLEEISRLKLLAEDGIIMAEHDKHVELPETIADLEVIRERRYGHIHVKYYSTINEDTEEEA